MKTYIFKTKMVLDKNISRDIEVAGNVSLYRLAGNILKAYGFYFDHAFGFYSNMDEMSYFDSEKMYELFTDVVGVEKTENAGSVEETKIVEVWQNIGDKMMFLFDYGDGWRFTVELAGFEKKEEGTKYPRVLKTVGKAPKQYG